MIFYGIFVVRIYFLLCHLYWVKKEYTAEIKRFGKRVKQLREAKGLTQQALAGLADTDIRTVQRIEKGEHSVGLRILHALADALKIDVAELFKS